MAEHVERVQFYETPEVTVTFDPNLCPHGGSVFEACPGLYPREEVGATCTRSRRRRDRDGWPLPSGALQIRPRAAQ
jgi:hypothetical protein